MLPCFITMCVGCESSFLSCSSITWFLAACTWWNPQGPFNKCPHLHHLEYNSPYGFETMRKCSPPGSLEYTRVKLTDNSPYDFETMRKCSPGVPWNIQGWRWQVTLYMILKQWESAVLDPLEYTRVKLIGKANSPAKQLVLNKSGKGHCVWALSAC